MTALRVAFIRSRYTAFGGAERFLDNAIQALRADRVDVTLITRQWRQPADLNAIICDPFFVGRLWRDWGFGRAACRRLAKERFDLVQSHERIACCDVYRAGDGVHVEWLRQRRRELSAFGRLSVRLNPYHHYVAAAERALFASARLRAVICNSRMVRDEIMKRFGLAERKLHVIYSGVDTERFHPRLRVKHFQQVRSERSIPVEAALFLFVGSGFERKGLARAMHALATLPSEAYLLVVGRDKNQPAFAQLAATLGIAARVRFAGGLVDVAPSYGAADALVLPTLYDPFPNAALEAMASGLPVITSSKSGAAELIEQGVNGWVCDSLDTGALTAAMRAALDKERCEVMAKAARERVEPLTLQKMAQDYINLYRSLLRGHST